MRARVVASIAANRVERKIAVVDLAALDRIKPLDALTPLPAETPKTDKTAKNYHRKSASRDARFYEERKPLCAASPSLSGAGTSVCISSTNPPSSKTKTIKAREKRSRCETWRDQDKGLGGLFSHHVAAPWRDLSFPGLVQELADTLLEEGHAVAVTARLSPEIEAKALAAPSTIAFLQQRAAYELRMSFRAGKLSAVPDFVLVIHQIRGRETHVHGLLGAPSADLPEIRQCFRRACGEWKTNRQHQVKTDADVDDGWTSYLLKDRAKSLKFVRAMKLASGSMGTTFTGKPYTATTGLRRRAQERYERMRGF